MKRRFRVSLFVAAAFIGGMSLQSTLYARLHRDFPRRIVWEGKASWYSQKDPGVRPRTANNEVFDDGALTCAMWGVPFNQKIRVTNLSNGKSVVVRVNDRGPHYRYLRRGRIVDLTKEAFSRISPLKAGLIDVAVEFL